MFCDEATARRIEGGEARLSMAVARAVAANARDVEVTPIAGGVSVLAGPAQVNKVIGVGFAGVPDDAALAAIEATWWARGLAVRFEVSALADPALHLALTTRGYQLHGFEHVLARPLAAAPAPVPGVEVAPMAAGEVDRWIEVALAGWTAPDGSGVSADPHDTEHLAALLRDLVTVDAVAHYFARVGGADAGTGGAYHDRDRMVYLVGASTVPAFRRRGVQRALVAARLADAAAAGCDLAVVTTAPGSKSQANATAGGFGLAYARAILVRPPPQGGQ